MSLPSSKSPFDDASGKELLAFLAGYGINPSVSGVVTVNGATPVSVSNTAVTADSNITFTLKTVGGTVGAIPTVKTITPGTGFTVAATAADTSIYNYTITN